MKKHYLIALIACVSFLSACKKNNSGVIEGEFKPAVVTNSKIRMFTNHGEVKDWAVIMNFLNSQQVADKFSFQSQDNDNFGISELQFREGKGSFIMADSQEPVQFTYKKADGQRYLLKRVIEGRILLPVGQGNGNNCSAIAGKMLLYPPEMLDYRDIPSTGGFRGSYIPSHDYVMDVNVGISFPILSYVVYNKKECMSAVYGQLNLLNENVLASLKESDTLLYQTRRMYFRQR